MALISDDTKKRFQSIKAKAEEVMLVMGIGSLEEAYSFLSAVNSEQALEDARRAREVAERIDNRQKKQAMAHLRSESARYNTFKENMADSD
jgi:hypothetical protein